MPSTTRSRPPIPATASAQGCRYQGVVSTAAGGVTIAGAGFGVGFLASTGLAGAGSTAAGCGLISVVLESMAGGVGATSGAVAEDGEAAASATFGFSPVALASPQMSSLLTVTSGLPVSALPAAGVGGATAVLKVGAAVGVVTVAANLSLSSCIFFSLARNSASSVLCRLISFSFLPLISSRSLTRDLSSPDSCSLLVSASLTRASSAFDAASPVPPARPPVGRSADPWSALPSRGGTRARRSPDEVETLALVDARGVAAVVSATRVGALLTLPRHSSICDRTAAAASRAEPLAAISSADGMRNTAPRLSALTLSLKNACGLFFSSATIIWLMLTASPGRVARAI